MEVGGPSDWSLFLRRVGTSCYNELEVGKLAHVVIGKL